MFVCREWNSAGRQVREIRQRRWSCFFGGTRIISLKTVTSWGLRNSRCFFLCFFFFDPSDYWKYIDASRWTWITYWIRRFLKFIIDFYVLFLINLLASLCLSLFGHTCWGTLPTLWCFFFGAVFEQICVLLPCHRHSGRFSISPSDGFLKSCQQLLQFHFVGLANAQFAFVLCGEACVFAIDIRHYIGRYPWKEKAGPSSHDDDTRMSHNS